MREPLKKVPLLPGTLKNLFFPPEKGEYTYFARAKEQPFVGGDFVTKGAWAADASMLAYGRYGTAEMPISDFQAHLDRGGLRCLNLIGADWRGQGTQGYFAANDQFAILAFRGTEPGDPVDAVYDGDILPVPELEYRSNRRADRFGQVAFVHHGFQLALTPHWLHIAKCVAEYRREHPKAEICFTGHSLGGALAILASSRLEDGNISVYTFGGPRVGDAGFSRRLLAAPAKTIVRFVNFNDSVAYVPTTGLYESAPRICHRFDEQGRLSEFQGSFLGDVAALATVFSRFTVRLTDELAKLPAAPGLVDHSAARYCIRLWNCL